MIQSRENLTNNFVLYLQVIVFALAATLVAAQEESEGGPQVSEVSEEDVEAGPNAQEVAGVRKLRLRRPRPKIIAIDNEEGIAEGKPVPLKAGRDGCQRKIVFCYSMHYRIVIYGKTI